MVFAWLNTGNGIGATCEINCYNNSNSCLAMAWIFAFKSLTCWTSWFTRWIISVKHSTNVGIRCVVLRPCIMVTRGGNSLQWYSWDLLTTNDLSIWLTIRSTLVVEVLYKFWPGSLLRVDLVMVVYVLERWRETVWLPMVLPTSLKRGCLTKVMHIGFMYVNVAGWLPLQISKRILLNVEAAKIKPTLSRLVFSLFSSSSISFFLLVLQLTRTNELIDLAFNA